MPLDPPAAARITRRALFDAVWSKPMIEIAADHDTSAYYIVSLCKRLGLPVPPLGHWQRVAVGRGAETPPFPAADKLDAGDHAIGRPAPGLGRGGRIKASAAETAEVPAAAPASAATPAELHKRVKPTSRALSRASSDVTTSCGGAGKFRVTVAPASVERTIAFLNRLVHAVEAQGWSTGEHEQGLTLVPDGETIGFKIEEKTDRVPHVRNRKEEAEWTDYQRRLEQHARGIGYSPWAPRIPEHDYVPNGQLLLRLDNAWVGDGLRRTFGDGKTQTLEALLPVILESLQVWANAKKARDVERARQKAEWEERDRRQREAEARARVDGYRAQFLNRKGERLAELERIDRLLAYWAGQSPVAELESYLAWAKDYRARLSQNLTALLKRVVVEPANWYLALDAMARNLDDCLRRIDQRQAIAAEGLGHANGRRQSTGEHMWLATDPVDHAPTRLPYCAGGLVVVDRRFTPRPHLCHPFRLKRIARSRIRFVRDHRRQIRASLGHGLSIAYGLLRFVRWQVDPSPRISQ